jgi:tetratricopeptide (TPR) repeat protein
VYAGSVVNCRAERTKMNRASGSEYVRDYLDFDLEIREGDPQGYSVAVHSPAGEAEEQMRFPFDERQLRDRLKDLEIALLRSGSTRRSLSSEEQTVQDFGRSLFEAVLVGKVGTCYYRSLDQAQQQGKGLRLKLHVQPPNLTVLPWEFLYDPDRDEYLCFSRDTPIVRYTDLRQPISRLTVAPPLRILGMVVSPRDLDPLDVEHEKGLMDEAIEDLQAKGLVELIWLEGDTWRDLQRAMRRGGPWHIFHFVGHGDFDMTVEEGLIAFAQERTGRKHLLRSRDLARLLDGHPYLRLVFLNSCEGARGSEGDPFSGTAATLVRRGIPAVVAMQYQITDQAAIEFSSAFYESLADGLPVDAAVTEARVAVSMDSMLEWGTPVLYMRSPDGRLFDLSAPAPIAHRTPETNNQQEVDSLRRYREAVESAWADGELQPNKVQRLRVLANNELGLSQDAAAKIEREVMGDSIETILKRQEEAALQGERNRRLAELYDQARRLRQDQEWQAVIDVFDQIHEEDRDYPDPAGLLASAREALETTERRKRVATLYERGHRYMVAREWQQALECFEYVQRLNPEYKDTEEQLARVRRALAPPPTVEVPDLLGQRVSEARSSLASKGLELSVYEEVPSDTIAEGEIIQQSPEPGTEVLAGSSVGITVSSGSTEAISTAPMNDQTGEYTNRIERVQRVLPASAGSRWALILRGLAMGIFGLVLLLFSIDAGSGYFQLYSALLIIADALFTTIDARTGFGRRRLLVIQGRISGLIGLAMLLVWLGGHTQIIPTVKDSFTDFIRQWHIGTSLVGSWAIFVGIIRTVAAVKLRGETQHLLLMGTSGVLLVFSGMLLWSPSFDSWRLLGFLMLTSAIALIVVAVRMRDREAWGSRAR